VRPGSIYCECCENACGGFITQKNEKNGRNPLRAFNKIILEEKDLGAMYTVRSVGIGCQKGAFSWLDRNFSD